MTRSKKKNPANKKRSEAASTAAKARWADPEERERASRRLRAKHRRTPKSERRKRMAQIGSLGGQRRAGKSLSEEHRAKIAEAMRLRWANRTVA